MINWIFIGILMGASFISTLISFIDLIISIKDTIKKRCCSKSRIKNYSSKQPSDLKMNKPNFQNPASVCNPKTDNSVSIMEEEKKFSFSKATKVIGEKKEHLSYISEENSKQDYDYLDSVLNMHRLDR